MDGWVDVKAVFKGLLSAVQKLLMDKMVFIFK
jgi:hypothetical protein